MPQRLCKEITDYVKYNTGKFSNKFIQKKTGLNSNNLRRLQNYTKITVSNSFLGFDYIKRNDFLKEIGITKYFLTLLKTNNLIETKIIGKFEVIELEEMERFQKFLTNWLTFEQVKEILNITDRHYLNDHLNNVEKMKLNYNKFLYSKSDILKLRNQYINLTVNTYSIIEFSKKINYCIENIHKLIKKGKLNTVIIKTKIIHIKSPIRIPKTELIKFQ